MRRSLSRFRKPAGTFKVVAFSSLDDVLSDPAICVVDVTEPPGPVPPGPVPPVPIPVPPGPTPSVYKDAWIIVVTDNANQSVDQGKIVGDKVLWDGIEAKGPSTLIVDKDSATATAGHYNDYIQKAVTGFPALLFLQKDGTYIKAIPLPKSEADILTEVKKITG